MNMIISSTFLGSKWTRFFLCTTTCDLYGITWLVASIFGQALAEQVPVTRVDDDYKMWVGVFMLATVPLSCTSILDQALLQLIFFLAGRMLMVLLMMGIIIVAMIHSDQEYFGDQVGPVRDTPVVDWNHTITIIQTAIFQFSVPGMASVSNNKKSMTGFSLCCRICVCEQLCVGTVDGTFLWKQHQSKQQSELVRVSFWK